MPDAEEVKPAVRSAASRGRQTDKLERSVGSNQQLSDPRRSTSTVETTRQQPHTQEPNRLTVYGIFQWFICPGNGCRAGLE